MPKQGFFSRRPWLRDLLFVVLLVAGIRAYQQRDLVSGQAPQLNGVSARGEPLSLAAQAYQGRPVLVHFWATWCGVCRAEQGSIDAIARTHPVLSVSSSSGQPAEVAAYVDEHGIAPPVIVDTSSVLAKRYGVHAFPTSFILNREGKIAFREVGYTTELGLRARLWLAGVF